MSDENKLSRRDFIKGAAVGAAAVALPNLAATPAAAQVQCPATIPTKWDYEADVVIVGYGGAGAVTAMTAHDAGAKVIILEKYPQDTATEVRHTPSTRYCGTSCFDFTSADLAAQHLYALSKGATPMDICKVWGEGALKTKEFYTRIGLKINVRPERARGKGGNEFPFMVGGNDIEGFNTPGAGPEMWKQLSREVEKDRKIQVLYQTPAKHLIQDASTKEIKGVIASSGGKDIAVKAKKAVVLCTGGFEWNEEMKLNYGRGYPAWFYSNPNNTGDGIKMGQEVGAALWHMNVFSARAIPYHPDWPKGFGVNLAYPFMIVNNHGKRWFYEVPWASHNAYLEFVHFDGHSGEYPAIPAWIIYDSATPRPLIGLQEKGFLPDGKTLQPWIKWSNDMVEEVKKGWVLKADTMEDLAAQILKDPENKKRMVAADLKETFTKFNQYCAAGKDPEFGREPKSLVPLAKPPFYCLKIYPGGPNTQGGVKKNAKAQVLDPFDNPIPRLYAVGELGSVYGFLYPMGGGNVTEFIIFGQVAGKNVAAEKPWDAKA